MVRLRAMSSAVLALAFAASAEAAPIPGGKKLDPPSYAGQINSVSAIVEYIANMAGSIGRGGHFDENSKTWIEEAYGEKALTGIDFKKPVAFYGTLKPKFENSSFFFIVPVTGEKAGLELLEKFGFAIEKETKFPGLSRIKNNAVLPEQVAMYLRFVDSEAYVGVNVDPDEMDASKLHPRNAIVDAQDKDTVSIRLAPDKFPDEILETPYGLFASANNSLKQLAVQRPQGMPASFPELMIAAVSWADRNLKLVHKEAELLTIRATPKAKSVDLGLEFLAKPKAKSSLAELAAKHKKTEGRFHQAGPKAMVNVSTAFTDLPEDFRMSTGTFLKDMLSYAVKEGGISDGLQIAFDTAGKHIEDAFHSSTVDMALYANDPNKDGLTTAVFAIGVPKGADAEKAFLTAMNDLGKDAKANFKQGAEKIGDVAVHTLTYKEAPKTVSDAFGKEIELRIAYAADAFFMAVGPDALAELKDAVALKPKPGKAHQLRINGKKVTDFLAKLIGNGGAGMFFTMIFGSDDELATLWAIDVLPGNVLSVKIDQHRFGLLFSFGFGLFR